MNIPRVSICIPTYNQGRFIGECVESVLSQTFQDIEVVISVNHCTDNTEEILANYSDPRIRIIKPRSFLPVAENFKFCISKSRGHYINYLSSDDLLLPEFIESQAAILDKYPRVAFVHSAAERINEKGEIIRLEKSIHRSFIRKGSDELKRYIGGMKCVGDALLIRRSAYEAVGGIDTDLLVDWDLCLRLLQYGDVAYNERVLMKYRDWDDEYRSGERRWRSFIALVSYYDQLRNRLSDTHPGLLNTIERARRKEALSFITTFIDYDFKTREEIEDQILRLSDSWPVRVKIFMVKIGLGFIARGKKQALLWLRKKIKPVIYSLNKNIMSLR